MRERETFEARQERERLDLEGDRLRGMIRTFILKHEVEIRCMSNLHAYADRVVIIEEEDFEDPTKKVRMAHGYLVLFISHRDDQFNQELTGIANLLKDEIDRIEYPVSIKVILEDRPVFPE